MCGLVGVITKSRNGFSKKQQEVFAALLYVDYLRGQDSTGVFLVDNNGDVCIVKEASVPSDFMSSDEFGSLLNVADKRGAALIGHNRKATHGVVNDENAHPFWVDDKIVLVHNGVMYGDHKKVAEVEVDSHAIAHVLVEKETTEEALKSINAAYALIWYDVQNKKLHTIRNASRPLWWVETSSEWIIASEKEMLDLVISRYDLKPNKEPTIFSVDSLQMWSLGNNGGWNATYRTLDLKTAYTRPSFDQNELECRRAGYGDSFNNDDDGGDVFDLPKSKLPFPTSAANTATRELVQIETRGNRPRLNYGLLEDYERNLARNSNKCVPNGQFYSQVAEKHPKGNKVIACAFEYAYANMIDSSSGFYLYLQVWDDPDIICRVFFDEKALDRIDQMAGTSYVYELEVNRKWWGTFAKMDKPLPTTPGYCILDCIQPKLIYGGGMGDAEWADKLTRNMVKH